MRPYAPRALNVKPSLAKPKGCSKNTKSRVNDNDQCLGLFELSLQLTITALNNEKCGVFALLDTDRANSNP